MRYDNARADVTATVRAKVGSGGGRYSFAVDTDPRDFEGVGLIVLYSSPTLPRTTIALMEGAAEQEANTATLTYAKAIDPTVPGFAMTLSIGSGYSYQVFEDHICGGGQTSEIDVNGDRLTSCAGNYDDGESQNGALITLGGVDDTVDNPVDPNATTSPDGTTTNSTICARSSPPAIPNWSCRRATRLTTTTSSS